MAPRYTPAESDRIVEGHHVSHRTRGAIRKHRSRLARNGARDRPALILAQDLFQPPVTPESFQQSATSHQGPVTAAPPLARQAGAETNQSELAKMMNHVNDRFDHMEGKPGERHAFMQLNTGHGPQPRGNAISPEFLDIANQPEGSTDLASTVPTASALGSSASLFISAPVDLPSLPPDTDEEDFAADFEILQRYNERAATSPQAETEVGQGLDTQACIDLADGIYEGHPDAMALWAESGCQVEEAVEDDSMFEEDEVEGSDYEQFFDYTAFDDADDGAGDDSDHNGRRC